MAKRGVERRTDDEHPGVAAGDPLADRLEEQHAAHVLVRDHEDAVLLGGVRRRCLTNGRLGIRAPEDPPEAGSRERDKDGNAEPDVDHRPDHDQREVADRQEDEAEGVGLAPDRIPHR